VRGHSLAEGSPVAGGGRTPAVFLLDTNVAENPRELPHHGYSTVAIRRRIPQEIVLASVDCVP